MKIEVVDEDGVLVDESNVDNYVMNLLRELRLKNIHFLSEFTADKLGNYCGSAGIGRVRTYLKSKGIALKGE